MSEVLRYAKKMQSAMRGKHDNDALNIPVKRLRALCDAVVANVTPDKVVEVDTPAIPEMTPTQKRRHAVFLAFCEDAKTPHKDLAEKLKVSESTIKRDIEHLKKEGALNILAPESSQ